MDLKMPENGGPSHCYSQLDRRALMKEGFALRLMAPCLVNSSIYGQNVVGVPGHREINRNERL